MLDMESIGTDIVASWGVSKGKGVARVCVGGSRGASLDVSSESLWWPEGVRGRRRVPLLGAGVMLMESQTML